MGLGDAWEVADVWFEPHEGADKLHAGVARRRGAAVPRPVCGAPRGARDSRERTWRHLDVWQHGTIVRCAVPRADHSGVARAGVDDTPRAGRRTHVSVTADLDAGRAAARPCAQLEAHGGDAPAIPEVTRDMAAPCSLGCAGATPNASQAVDRLHVMRLAPREADRVRRAEAKSSAEGAAARGDQVPPAEEAGEPGGAPGGQEGVAHVGAPAHRPRDGRGAPGGPPHARRGAGRPRARSVAGLGGALQRPADEKGRGDRAGGARGNPQLALPQVDQRRHGGDEPGHPAHEEGGPRLPRPRRLHRPDLPRARPPGVRGGLGDRLCYPLKTSKSQKKCYLSKHF